MTLPPSAPPSLPPNPLVRLIKIKKGIKEKIEPNKKGGLEFTIQQLLYAHGDRRYDSLKLVDYTPVVLVLSCLENRKRYELFPLSRKAYVSGIFGLDLNLLFTPDEKNNKILHTIKVKILSLYLTYLAPGSTEFIKIGILKELKEIILELIDIDATRRVFLESPFFMFESKFILFSETLIHPKTIAAYKNYSPPLTLRSGSEKLAEIPLTNVTKPIQRK